MAFRNFVVTEQFSLHLSVFAVGTAHHLDTESDQSPVKDYYLILRDLMMPDTLRNIEKREMSEQQKYLDDRLEA
jgi:hypothetical protein